MATVTVPKPSWTIVLATRQNWDSPLVEVESFIIAEGNLVQLWVNEKLYREYAMKKTANDQAYEQELEKLRKQRELDIADAKRKGSSQKQIDFSFSNSLNERAQQAMPYPFLLNDGLTTAWRDEVFLDSVAQDAVKCAGANAPRVLIVPLCNRGSLLRGFQPALKIIVQTDHLSPPPSKQGKKWWSR